MEMHKIYKKENKIESHKVWSEDWNRFIWKTYLKTKTSFKISKTTLAIIKKKYKKEF